MAEILTEKIIAFKAIELIADNPGINTSELKSKLEEYFVLHEDDKRILKNRNDSHFSQKVRNLASHYDTNIFGKYTIKGPPSNRSTTWTLNSEGVKLVSQKQIEYYEDVIQDETFIYDVQKSKTYNDYSLLIAENRAPEFQIDQSLQRVKKDARIAKTYLKNNGYQCQVNPKHISFTSKTTNENYVEAHHLIPIKAQKDYSINLDRSENLVSLCPICHKEIHLGINPRVKELVSKLLDIKFDDLKRVGLKINLDELFYKYYT